MDPFPLQGNLRKLKPSIGKGFSGVAVLLYFVIDQFRNRISWFADKPEVWVAVGLAGLVFLYIALDLYLRQIYFNESGIGISMRFGGRATWFSFLELKEVNLFRRKGMMGRPRQSRLVLEFHTGVVKLRTRLYDSKGIGELMTILRTMESRLQQGPSQVSTMPPSGTRQDTKPPSYPKGPPPARDPGYRNLSGDQPKVKSLKQQLKEWKQNPPTASRKNNG